MRAHCEIFRLSRRGKTSVLGLRPGSRAGCLQTRAADARDARVGARIGSGTSPRRHRAPRRSTSRGGRAFVAG
jgi:hypothetical protein